MPDTEASRESDRGFWTRTDLFDIGDRQGRFMMLLAAFHAAFTSSIPNIVGGGAYKKMPRIRAARIVAIRAIVEHVESVRDRTIVQNP